jgi:5-formyltetrahydrofolate cyclo-ligase
VPVGPEPGGADLPDVLMDALPPGGRLLLPVLLDDGDLDWAVYSGTLVPGPRGLLEPDGPRLGVDAIREASLVVVPALAISAAGVRLGRGGGSYDRVLSRLATPIPAVSPASPRAWPAGGASSDAAGPRGEASDPAGPGVAASDPGGPGGRASDPGGPGGRASDLAGTAGGTSDPAGTADAASDTAGTAGGRWTVALLYDGELVDVVPAEAHDRAVHAAITPSGGLTLSRSAEWTN